MKAKQLARAVEAVRSRSTDVARGSVLHGERHWRDVARVGRELRSRGVPCDPLIVFLFALTHDSQRHSDGRDPDHGTRAAGLAAQLRGYGIFVLSDTQANVLYEALTWHNQPYVSDDPTMGACWDADRLTLARLRVTPQTGYLSTDVAPNLIQWAAGLVQGADMTWEKIGAAI